MVSKIFWQDPYLAELDTHLTSVKGDEVTVAETIFFAFSGGQEGDQGTIGGHRVVSARKHDLEIIYTLEPDHGLAAGDAVNISIDWSRRYKLMRLHFAAELVLELAYQRLGGVTKVGAHIAEDKARIDFEWPENISGLLAELEAEVRGIVGADQPIICGFSDEANERRYWKIENFSEVPCGGTHVRKTGEIGKVTLKRKNPGKGKERIEIVINNDVSSVQAGTNTN